MEVQQVARGRAVDGEDVVEIDYQPADRLVGVQELVDVFAELSAGSGANVPVWTDGQTASQVVEGFGLDPGGAHLGAV